MTYEDGFYYCHVCNLNYEPERADRTAVTVRIADVQREEVTWLWADRVPAGRLTLITGDPGVGKSWGTLAIATAVTTGAGLPGDPPREPGRVLLLTAEDGLADTVRPRLEDMGADLTRVTALRAVRDLDGDEHHPSLVDDLPVLRDLLAVGKYSLVIIDPINAYLGSTLDTHRDAALRSALTPLANLAEQWDVAVIAVGHLNKSSRDRAIYRANGSIAYIGAPRVVHLVGLNPDNERERVVCCIKNNLAAIPTALSFELNEGQFYWLGETEVTASALLSPDDNEEERSGRSEAIEFLQEVLGEGEVEARVVEDQARTLGISPRTLRRARKELGVRATRVGGAGHQGAGKWVWSQVKAAKVANIESGHLNNNGHLTKFAVEELR